jgi:hypothetical protein
MYPDEGVSNREPENPVLDSFELVLRARFKGSELTTSLAVINTTSTPRTIAGWIPSRRNSSGLIESWTGSFSELVR